MASCNFKWVGGFWRVIHFTAAHAQRAIRRANLHWYYLRRRVKIFLNLVPRALPPAYKAREKHPGDEVEDSTWKNLARVAADEQNGPSVRESPEKVVPTRRQLLIGVFATSVYKQPTTSSKPHYNFK